MFRVAVDGKTWKQWFVGEEAGAEDVDSNRNQNVRYNEQSRREGCYAMLRALHLLRCVARKGDDSCLGGVVL